MINEPSSNIHVVLVRPQQPGNIGSVCRAMKTMGFSKLTLVEPERFPHPEAVWMASSAADILSQLNVVSTLAEALQDTEYVVGTTARECAIGVQPVPLREGVSTFSNDCKTALVFGNERTGLTEEDRQFCHAFWYIPASKIYNSLNLAQAVQVVLYEVSLKIHTFTTPIPSRAEPLATVQDLEGLFTHLESALMSSGYLDPKNPRHLMPRLRHFFKQRPLTRKEVDMWRGMLRAWET